MVFIFPKTRNTKTVIYQLNLGDETMKRIKYVIISMVICIVIISIYIQPLSQRNIGGTKEFMYIEQKNLISNDNVSNGFIATPLC